MLYLTQPKEKKIVFANLVQEPHDGKLGPLRLCSKFAMVHEDQYHLVPKQG